MKELLPFLMVSRAIPTIIGVALLFLSSCQPIYRPTVVNQPMMSGQGDVQASGHIGTNGGDLQIAGAPTEHIVAIADYNAYSREDDSTNVKREHRSFEIGAGYFRHFSEEVNKENNSGGLVELIGGYGHGKANNRSSIWTPRDIKVTGNYHKFFFQPGVGFHHDVFDIGFTSRVVGIDYYEIRIREDLNQSIEPTTSPGLDYFFEPALTGRIGYKFVKFQFQFGGSIPVGSVPRYDHQPFMFSVGLHVDISQGP
jgi:hypothetical protein